MKLAIIFITFSIFAFSSSERYQFPDDFLIGAATGEEKLEKLLEFESYDNHLKFSCTNYEISLIIDYLRHFSYQILPVFKK